MYCKNCGSFLNVGNSECTVCNSLHGIKNNYCETCGAGLMPDAIYCTRCGKKNTEAHFVDDLKSFFSSLSSTNGRSKKNTLILGVVLGFSGIHNFYLGHNVKGLIQLLLFIFNFGFFSYAWSVVELVLILTGKTTKDAKGVILAE